MEVKVKYLADVPRLCKTDKGDWIDLYAAEEVELQKGEYKLVRLGVAIEIPKGYEALVAPRSSTFKNFKVLQANSLGVIDQTYCGDNDEWRFLALAVEDTVIHKGDRICQFRLIENMPTFEFTEVDTLGNEDRGGYGSTGVR